MYDFSDTSALANASEESIDSLSQAIDVLLRHMNTSQTSFVYDSLTGGFYIGY